MSAWRHSAALLSAAVGAPLGAAALALRPRWREGWRERLGLLDRQEPGAIWVHGASVGEILAAGRLPANPIRKVRRAEMRAASLSFLAVALLLGSSAIADA